ncbi:hypothetical protein ABZ570_33185 [Micromonospora sp. NPDC007271]|uniref:hypothetical protein n=1 Tax=Micromonospora sp. NPDC007271 TaxID=3154587 RepID=UPI0033EF5403
MLPIALTCPVWWVARWTARMLASLAVVVACSLGAATLPLGPAAAAQTGAPTPAVDLSALRAGHLSGLEPGAGPARPVLLRWSGRAAAAVAGAGRGAPGAVAGRGAHDGRTVSGADTVAGAADRQVVLNYPARADRASGVPAALGPVDRDGVPADREVTVPVDRRRVLDGLLPAAVGSRAPPAR